MRFFLFCTLIKVVQILCGDKSFSSVDMELSVLNLMRFRIEILYGKNNYISREQYIFTRKNAMWFYYFSIADAVFFMSPPDSFFWNLYVTFELLI